MSAPELAQAHAPAAQVADLLQQWEEEASRVCAHLMQGRRESAGRRARMVRGDIGWVMGPPTQDGDESDAFRASLKLEVCSPAEIDELFGALSRGRMANSP